jgi:tetratricopeptide (TPR) repeat protein
MNKLIAEYRQLVKRPESLNTLDATFSLLERATGLEVRVHGPDLTVKETEAWNQYGGSWKRLPKFRNEAAAEGFGRLGQRRVEQRARVQDKNRFVRVAWYLDTLPQRPRLENLPESQYSFIIDTLLLLFHQAYFVLLPRLEEAGWTSERRHLISSFFTFSEFVPDIAERFRVAGLAYEAQGDLPNALVSFEKALTATHVDEHAFMTRLQTLWMVLLDRGRFREALDLLLRIMPMVPFRYLTELRQLISETFDEYGAARRNGRAAG